MNEDILKGNWKMLKGKIKEKWGKLTDEDLTEIDGKKDQLLGKIQKRYGIEQDEADKQLSAWEKHCDDHCDKE